MERKETSEQMTEEAFVGPRKDQITHVSISIQFAIRYYVNNLIFISLLILK